VNEQLSEQLNQRWCQLCQLAVVEPGSEKLMKLVREVNLLFDARDASLTAAQGGPTRA
jgi:hypothetical protein